MDTIGVAAAWVCAGDWWIKVNADLHNGLTVFATDLCDVFETSKDLTADDVLQLAQQANPTFELENWTKLVQILSALTSSAKMSVIRDHNGVAAAINFMLPIAMAKFHLNLVLDRLPDSAVVLRDTLIRPLIAQFDVRVIKSPPTLISAAIDPKNSSPEQTVPAPFEQSDTSATSNEDKNSNEMKRRAERLKQKQNARLEKKRKFR